MTAAQIASASAEIAAPAAVVFELIADPSRHPDWDGNENLAQAPSGQRIRGIGEVFDVTLTQDVVRENHVVEFTEGRLVAWCPAEPGQPILGHRWRWEIEPLAADRVRVTHTYDWTELRDENRFARARATTGERLAASITRLADIAERIARAPKTAIVTGAGSGIGRETAVHLADQGWRVIAVARSEETLAALAEHHDGIEPRPADLTDFPLQGLVPERVDALVHAAGLIPVDQVERATPADWSYAFALNVTAGAELARQALPALRATRGTVVFLNSGAGFIEIPRNPLYGATKHALRALANGLRAEVEDDGIRVTSVFPGPVDTPMFTGDVDRADLIRPATVARAVVEAITASDDTQLTEIRVRPRRELSW